MKSANAALLALFASNQHFEQFDLYTITLYSGLVLRYSACPFDVVFGGNTWLCARSVGGVVIDEAGDSGPRAHWTTGFNTGSWSVTVMPRPSDVIGNIPWLPAVVAGILQEATVRVDRGYVLAWPATPTLKLAPVGLVNVFFGRMAEIDFGRSSVALNINDPRELLDIDMPRNLYSAQCRYALFDSQCSLDRNAFANHIAVTALTPEVQILVTNAAGLPDNYYTLGNAVFTSGQNAGLRNMIVGYAAAGTVYLRSPMPFTIAPGDTLTIYPGCDKSTATCQNKFGNLLNYGGTPLIPAAETAI
jgi:hypothetical protein